MYVYKDRQRTLKRILEIDAYLIVKYFIINVEIRILKYIVFSASYEDPKTRCDYVLKLHIGFSFSSYCDRNCRLEQIQYLTCKTRPFGHPINDSFLLTLYPIDSSGFVTIFNIHEMLFCKLFILLK